QRLQRAARRLQPRARPAHDARHLPQPHSRLRDLEAGGHLHGPRRRPRGGGAHLHREEAPGQALGQAARDLSLPEPDGRPRVPTGAKGPKEGTMRKTIVLALLLAVSATASHAAARKLSATLRGIEEVPAISTAGAGTFNGTLNGGETELTFTLTFS